MYSWSANSGCFVSPELKGLYCLFCAASREKGKIKPNHHPHFLIFLRGQPHGIHVHCAFKVMENQSKIIRRFYSTIIYWWTFITNFWREKNGVSLLCLNSLIFWFSEKNLSLFHKRIFIPFFRTASYSGKIIMQHRKVEEIVLKRWCRRKEKSMLSLERGIAAVCRQQSCAGHPSCAEQDLWWAGWSLSLLRMVKGFPACRWVQKWRELLEATGHEAVCLEVHCHRTRNK